jgi:hypothetical protein
MHVSVVLACLVGLAATTAEESTMKVNFPDPRPKGSAPPVMDDLSYQVMHTIKGSYTAIGPLQVRAPSNYLLRFPSCAYPVESTFLCVFAA